MRIKVKIMRKAFTLIELLVVVAIIGVLATVIMISVGGAKASSRYAKTLAEMTDMAKAVKLYKEINGGVYPDTWISSGAVSGTSDSGTGVYVFNNDLTGANANKFLVDYFGSTIPKPDCSGGNYAFYTPAPGRSGTTRVIYFPPTDPGHSAATFPLDEVRPDDIRKKVTKKITCKETVNTGTSTDFMN